MDAPFIYLASQSPRRQQLLDQIGVAHRPLAPGADEDAEALEAVQSGEAPEAYVERVTRAKLAVALQRLACRGLPPAPVLCADTTVALGNRILGKPADAAEAASMLRALAGGAHRVVTGVAVAWAGSGTGAGTGTAAGTGPGAGAGAGPPGEPQAVAYRHSVSKVCFAPMTNADIVRYVATGEPFGKAGAYAIQGKAAIWIARIVGSGSGIMGLPLHETAELLRAAGFAF